MERVKNRTVLKALDFLREGVRTATILEIEPTRWL